MIDKGVSLYPGLGDQLQEGLDFLDQARAAGFSRLFTSLHIPESDPAALLGEFRRMLAHAAALGFSVTADISPRAFDALGAPRGDLSALAALGLDAVRLDFGFSPAEIAAWAGNAPLPLVLNASTLDEAALEQLLATGADPARLAACHNYYPRPETGLSWELFTQRSRALRARGIAVAAFIPSRHHPRGPLRAGLPTLEAHRAMASLQAAKHLFWSDEIDTLLIGDPLASPEEITGIGALDPGCVELQVIPRADLGAEERALLFADHANRRDPPHGAVRAATHLSTPVPAAGGQNRPRGSVTLDNALYRRYSGNLQILRHDLPPDERVNVVAQVAPEEMFLLDLITPGRKFRLVEAPVRK